ncbi:hypothetical protein C8R47DRAFT_1105777 [Mycena vitilis]|nr:hypothetical protein C8R47DRAFT_1105777 [Mycena vitilis]
MLWAFILRRLCSRLTTSWARSTAPPSPTGSSLPPFPPSLSVHSHHGQASSRPDGTIFDLVSYKQTLQRETPTSHVGRYNGKLVPRM